MPLSANLISILTEIIRRTTEINIDTGTADATSLVNRLDDAAKNWPVNAFANVCIVEITAGTGAGQIRLIASNTATSLVPATNFATAPDATSEYAIRLFGKQAEVVPIFIDPYTNTGNINPAVVRSTPAGRFKLAKVHIHWSVATSNPVTIALDAAQGAAYDTVLRLVPLGANQNLTEYFPDNALFEPGDVITVAWTDDTGGAATWGVEIGTVPC